MGHQSGVQQLLMPVRGDGATACQGHRVLEDAAGRGRGEGVESRRLAIDLELGHFRAS